MFQLPLSEVRAIINHVVGQYMRLEDCTPDHQRQIKAIMGQRAQGVPLAKIVGYKEFWKDRFITNMHTLDPRPDSETLIEAVLEVCPRASYRILDLGTGTGCLLLSLLREYPEATGVGVDISPDALDIAKQNGENLGLSDRVEWIQSDWCAGVEGAFDIIVSNPPYIGADESINIGATFDPALALYGGIGTYEVILRSILTLSSSRRRGSTVSLDHPMDPRLREDDRMGQPAKYLFFEVGYQQAPLVMDLLKQYSYNNVSTKKDLAGYERVVVSCG